MRSLSKCPKLFELTHIIHKSKTKIITTIMFMECWQLFIFTVQFCNLQSKINNNNKKYTYSKYVVPIDYMIL